MEELLPLESYYARSQLTVRRLAALGGSAFGLVMGPVMGLGMALAVGPAAGALAGLVTAVLTGSAFAGVWGSFMLRMRRARDERAYENDATLMGESLEDSFRYRMPCSLVQGRRLVSGTLYVDRDRGAFVPVRTLADEVPTVRFALEPSPFAVEPWQEAPWWARWSHAEADTLRVATTEESLRFHTPDAQLAVSRLTALLPVPPR